MKRLILVFGCLMMTGCGKWERTVTAWTGDLSYKCSRQGIEYVQSDSGIAVSLGSDGLPIKCQN